MIKRSVPQIIAILALLWALYPHNPYGYYTFLRLVCCGVFGYLTISAIGNKKPILAWMCVITALIYNPIVPVHLTRNIWTVINLITVGFAIASIWILSPPKAKNITPQKTEDKDPKSIRRPPPKIGPVVLTLEQRGQNHPHSRYFLQMQRDILAGPAEPGYDDDPLEHLGEEPSPIPDPQWCLNRKRAEQGHALAQYILGIRYHGGIGVKKDDVEAVKWFRKAADQGDAQAQFVIWGCYTNGIGVEKDEGEGVKWLRKAAEQGHVAAQSLLDEH